MTKQDYLKTMFNRELFEIVEELNYSNIICKVNPNDYDKLLKLLKIDNCNHLNRIEYVKKQNNMFFIENCDLQDVFIYIDNENAYDDYIICDIVFTENGFILRESEN